LSLHINQAFYINLNCVFDFTCVNSIYSETWARAMYAKAPWMIRHLMKLTEGIPRQKQFYIYIELSLTPQPKNKVQSNKPYHTHPNLTVRWITLSLSVCGGLSSYQKGKNLKNGFTDHMFLNNNTGNAFKSSVHNNIPMFSLKTLNPGWIGIEPSIFCSLGRCNAMPPGQ
jgi:hypothetical protein